MDPDSRVPSSRPFASRLGRPAMTRSRPTTSSASPSPLNPLYSQDTSTYGAEDVDIEGQDCPHVEGSVQCRCAACHLKPQVFPRRQDGRIQLPTPWLAITQSVPPSGPPPPRSMTPHTRGMDEGHLHVLALREPRIASDPAEGAPQADVPPNRAFIEVNTDRGEGSSRIARQLSGPGVAPPDDNLSRPDMSGFSSRSALSVEEGTLFLGQDRRSHRSDRSKSARVTKPYQRRPRHSRLGSDTQVIGPPQPQEYTGTPTSMLAATLPHQDLDRRQHVSSDPYETMRPEQFPQLLGPTSQYGHRSGNTFGPVAPNTALYSQDQPRDVQAPIMAASATVENQSYSSWDEHRPYQSREIYIPEFLPPHSRYSPPPLSLRPSSSQDLSDHYPFDSRSYNPFHTVSRGPSTVFETPTGQQPYVLSPPISHAGPSTISLTSPPDGEQTYPVQFQDPVVPEDPSGTSERHPEQLAIKWDSERKRRQGYFAVREEKSNFRHYNKSKIDFGK